MMIAIKTKAAHRAPPGTPTAFPPPWPFIPVSLNPNLQPRYRYPWDRWYRNLTPRAPSGPTLQGHAETSASEARRCLRQLQGDKCVPGEICARAAAAHDACDRVRLNVRPSSCMVLESMLDFARQKRAAALLFSECCCAGQCCHCRALSKGCLLADA